MAGDRHRSVRIAGGQPLQARGPGAEVGVRKVAEVVAGLRFQEAAAEQDPLARQPDGDVVPAVAGAGEEQLDVAGEGVALAGEVPERLGNRRGVGVGQFVGQGIGEGGDLPVRQAGDAAGAIAVEMSGHGADDRRLQDAGGPVQQHLRLLWHVSGVDQHAPIRPLHHQAVGRIVDAAVEQAGGGVQPHPRRQFGDPDGGCDPLHLRQAELQRLGQALVGNRGRAGGQRPERQAGAAGAEDAAGGGRALGHEPDVSSDIGAKVAPGRDLDPHSYAHALKLTLDYLEREGVPLDGFAVLFPSASPEAETGRKCGTLVLMPGELYEQGMAGDRTVFRYRRPAPSAGGRA